MVTGLAVILAVEMDFPFPIATPPRAGIPLRFLPVDWKKRGVKLLDASFSPSDPAKLFGHCQGGGHCQVIWGGVYVVYVNNFLRPKKSPRLMSKKP